MTMRTQVALRRELARVRAVLNTTDIRAAARDEAYGAQQALCWALGENAMAPSRSAIASARDRREGES